jgi:hypothetical protein
MTAERRLDTGRPLVDYSDYFHEADMVYDSDGERIGVIGEANPDYVIAESGGGFLGLGERRTYFVPRTQIARNDASGWYLAIDKDDIEVMGPGPWTGFALEDCLPSPLRKSPRPLVTGTGYVTAPGIAQQAEMIAPRTSSKKPAVAQDRSSRARTTKRAVSANRAKPLLRVGRGGEATGHRQRGHQRARLRSLVDLRLAR